MLASDLQIGQKFTRAFDPNSPAIEPQLWEVQDIVDGCVLFISRGLVSEDDDTYFCRQGKQLRAWCRGLRLERDV